MKKYDLDKYANKPADALMKDILKSEGLYPRNPIQALWWRIRYRKGSWK